METAHNVMEILLPPAHIHVYALDDGTAARAAAIAADWRFARVNVATVRGGIDQAIEHYRSNTSPEIIFIETDDISDSFIARLGDLAAVCATGTDAVIIGPKNDVRLYRSLIDMGVRDYLVRPVAEEDLIKVIARALVDKNGISNSRLVTVIGAKGGVGATSMAQVLATLAADSFTQKTILMDAAGSSGTLGVSFGLEPTASLTEGVRAGSGGTDDDMKRLLQSAGGTLSVLPWGVESLFADSPGADGIETLVNRLLQKTPLIVMDLSGALPSVQKRMLARAAHVVVVTSPHLPALRNARTLLNEIKSVRAGLAQVSVILNDRGIVGSDETAAADIEKALGQKPAAVVPYAPKVFAGAELSGQPVGRAKSGADFLKDLREVAALAAGVSSARAGQAAADKGGFDGLSIFKGLLKK